MRKKSRGPLFQDEKNRLNDPKVISAPTQMIDRLRILVSFLLVM